MAARQKLKDRVVKEFDVVVLHPRGTGLQRAELNSQETRTYIVQYPTRLKHLSQQRVDDVLFQPCHEKLETKMCSVPSRTDPDSAFSGVTKTTFRSRKIPTRAQYAVGTIAGNQLILRPVKAVLQMQPVFDYIDNAQRQEDHARQESAALAKQEALATQTRILGTSYKVRETNKSRNRKLKSFSYMKSLEHNDVPLPLHIERDADIVGRVPIQTAAAAHAHTDIAGASLLRADEYCQRMCLYRNGDSQDDELNHNSDKLNLLALKGKPVEYQVREVIRCGHVVAHSELTRILRHPLKTLSDKDIATLALEVAHLVQGHWVAKSNLWYKIPYHATCRDYILKQFEGGGVVTKIELHKVMKDLSPTLLEIMLNEISVFVPSEKIWRFKYDCDQETQHDFGRFASGKLRNLADLKKQIELGIGAGANQAHGSHMWGSHASHVGGGKRRRPSSSSGAHQLSGPGGSLESLSPAGYSVHRVMQRHNICTLPFMVEEVGKAGEQHSSAEISAALNKLCIEVRGKFIVRQTGNRQFDYWRAIVAKLFSEKQYLRRKDVMQAVQAKTGSSLPSASYKKLMKSIAQTGGEDGKQSAVWSLLPGDHRD